MIRAFAEFILRGRKEAIVAAFLASLIPFLSWVGIVIMVFVTLRKGMMEGLWILGWAMLPAVAFTIADPTWLSVENLFFGYFVVWILAGILRITHAWALVLEVGTVVGILTVVCIHLVMPEVSAWWLERISPILTNSEQLIPLGVDQAVLTETAKLFAQVACGFQVAAFLLNGIFNIMMGRALERMLYNPGGLRKELYELKLGKISSLLLFLILMGSFIHLPISIDTLPVIALLFVIAGLSLIHQLVNLTHYSWLWICCFYAALILLSPYSLVVVMGAALIDSWFNLRKRKLIVKEV